MMNDSYHRHPCSAMFSLPFSVLLPRLVMNCGLSREIAGIPTKNLLYFPPPSSRIPCGVLGSSPTRFTIKELLAENAAENHLLNSISLEKFPRPCLKLLLVPKSSISCSFHMVTIYLCIYPSKSLLVGENLEDSLWFLL